MHSFLQLEFDVLSFYSAEADRKLTFVVDSQPLDYGLWPRFVNNIEGCFVGPAKTSKAGLRHHLPDPFFPSLRAKAKCHFLRS